MRRTWSIINKSFLSIWTCYQGINRRNKLKIKGELTFDLEFISPVDTLITSPYGKKRFINDAPRSPHLATDIRGKEGTPILAPKDGRAVLVANHFYGGNIVILDHGGGPTTVIKDDYIAAIEMVSN